MEKSIRIYTDKEIVDGIRSDSSWAIQSLYTLDRNVIFNWVMNNSGDYEDAQDVLQEGVVAVCKNIVNSKYTLDDTTRLKTYLNRVCRYWWYNELRRRKPNYQIPEEYEVEDIIFENEGREELLGGLAKHFNQLGEKCQSVLRLRFWEGKKMEEIATLLGNTLQVVKNRSSKCISELYEMFNNSKP